MNLPCLSFRSTRSQPRFPLMFLLLLTLGLALRPFGAAAQSSGEKVDQLMQAMDVATQLTSVPDELREQFKSNPFGLPVEDNETMLQHFGEAYGRDRLLETARAVFMEEFDEEFADSALARLEQPAVRQVVEAEQRMNTLQGQRLQVVRMYEMDQEPPSEARRQLIEQLTEATMVPETTLNAYTSIFRAFVSAFSALSDRQNFSEAQIDGFVTNYRMRIQPQVRRESVDRYLITYYQLDEATLKAYIDFLQTNAGQWMRTTASKSIRTALESASGRFMEAIRSETGDQ